MFHYLETQWLQLSKPTEDLCLFDLSPYVQLKVVLYSRLYAHISFEPSFEPGLTRL